MINGLSFDIEDWFQVENLRSACPLEKWDGYELRVEHNTDILLDLLSRHNYRATFFILGWVAERRPNLVRKIASQGHEVASHGYNHEIIYKLTPESFRRDLARSKKILEDICGEPVTGYRAPNFSITESSLWAIDILKELGFSYDSSIFPSSFHDRYGCDGINDSRFFQFKNGLFEFPMTVYKIGNFCFPLGGGAYFRVMPYFIFKALLKKINKEGQRFIFYLHPWELDKGQPRVKVGLQYSLRHYTNIDKTERKLERLLSDFQFQPLREMLS